MLQAFHNDPAIKEKYLSRVIAHQNADEIIRGIGWDGKRGCAIGCLLHNYNHALLPKELGWPEWYGKLIDILHEGMSEARWPTLVATVTAKTPIGLNDRDFTHKIKAPFLVIVLESTLTTFEHNKYPNVLKAVQRSIALWKRADICSEKWEASWAKAATRAMDAEAAAWAMDAGLLRCLRTAIA